MPFFQTVPAAENLQHCWTASTMQDESARQDSVDSGNGNGKILEIANFETRKGDFTLD